MARRPERYAIPPGKNIAEVKAELQSALASELAARKFSYTRSDGSAWTLTLRDVVGREPSLEMAYNPNDCVELRWGGDSAACPDQAGKRRWYAMEQTARNEIGRDEQGTATQMAGPQDVDIRGLIAAMPDRVPYVQYMPGPAQSRPTLQ